MVMVLVSLIFFYCVYGANNCNYIQLNDGQTWYFAANECMKYQMNNITRSHIYQCIDDKTIEYKIYDSSDSCQGDNFDVAAVYTSRNTFAMNCGSTVINNCTINWNIYFLHGQCDTNNLNINDYQFNTIINNQCVKYNPNDLQFQQLRRNGNVGIEDIEATYRSTIWSCNEKKQLIQNTYLTENCQGASTSKVYNGCTSDNYKYFTSIC